jgi:DNA-binding transcriptional MerR regulator
VRIGELAARVGVNPKTIRYYEDIGVLPASERTPAGHRLYGEGDADRLTFVRTAQRLGFSLDQISEILAFRDRDQQPCDFVLDTLAHKVAELDRRIAETNRLRDQLVQLQAAAEKLPRSDAYCCSVIEHNDDTLRLATARKHRNGADSEAPAVQDSQPLR